MVIAIFLIAMAGITPVTAELTTVAEGGMVFVGEEGLTFTHAGTPVPAGTVLEWYAPGDTPEVASPAAIYSCQGQENEVISPATFQTRTGNWYCVNKTVSPAIVTKIINAQMPSIDVRAFNSETAEDMTNERVIKEDTYITFRLDSNLYQVIQSRPNYAPGDTTNIKVVVVDEEGSTYTALYNDDTAPTISPLTNLVPTTSQYYLPGTSSVTTTLTPNWALDRADYKAGVYTFYAQVNLNNAKDNMGTITGVTKSAVRTIEVGKDEVKIEANKDTVFRNNDFAVTITGCPNVNYVLWVKGSSSVAPETVPYIIPAQNSVTFSDATAGGYVFSGIAGGTTVAADVCTVPAPAGDYYAMVKLSSSGTRSIGFRTDETTKNQTYTIRTDLYKADAPFSPVYDTVKVKVEMGDVTLTASGDSSYYIGESIVLSGTNTDSDDTWLFMTGPNLKSKGAPLTDLQDGVVTGGTLDSNPAAGSWAPMNVETDDTWEYKWNTHCVDLDVGTYTIYAVTSPINKDDLGANDVIYATTSIVIKKPFVTAATSSTTVAKGDDLYITGNAEGDPTQGVAIWILGKNLVSYATETVEDNGAFSYEFSGNTDLAAEQYFVVVQHPMYNDQFDLTRQADNPTDGQSAVVRPILDADVNTTSGKLPPVFILEGTGSLQGSDAATALVNAMDSPDIDDTYYKLTFMIEEPWIQIDAIGDKYVSETFSITGTTNLAVGDNLIVEVISSSFNTTEKTQSSAFYGAGGTVLVTAGDKNGVNAWEFAVGQHTFTHDEYIVTVEGVEIAQTATQTFNVTGDAEPVEPVDIFKSFVEIDPAPGDLTPGERVTVHVIATLTGSGDNTFNPEDELEAYTGLEEPNWDYYILVNGRGIPRESTGQYVRLLGWDLSYPDTNEVKVDYTLVGLVPATTQTSDAVLFRLRQLDVNGNIPSDGELLIENRVIDPDFSVTSRLSTGWNLISTPICDPSIDTTGYLYETAYTYNATTTQYEAVLLKDMKPGEGYWVGAFEPANITFTGAPLEKYQKSLSNGWNLIGGLGIAMETTSINATPDALSGPLYQYNPDAYAYSRATILKPGQGYWASAAAPCTINVSITPPVAPA